MKHKIFAMLTSLALLLGMTMCGQATTLAAATSSQEPPLRLSEPVDNVIADLEQYIPEQMQQANVPGLAIALIRDNEVVWTEGFGIASTITGRPVTPETVFDVASISKLVTTYTALHLVEQGQLSLDEPITAYLSEPWLPPSDFGEQITLRHLASHSSGLTDNKLPVDKSITFAPGSDYTYSGVGFMYMQEAIQQVTGQSLEDAAREAVFEPLNMSSSSFENSASVRPRMANGHMDYKLPLLVFVVPFTIILITISLVGMLIVRISTGKWLPARKLLIGAPLVVAILTLLVLALAMGASLRNIVLLIILCATAFALAFMVILLIGRQVIARLPRAWQERKRQRVLTAAWIAMGIVALLLLSGFVAGPVPRGPSPQPSAIGTMRTTAGDLALFLIELADPQHLNADLATEMRTPQVSITDDFSWGLGPGIYHSRHGDVLWQNGNTFGFRSLMVIYPEQGFGVVVLTNSDQGMPVAVDVAQRALGGSASSSIEAFIDS